MDDDPRVRCVDCKHHDKRRWQCVNARVAQLQVRLGVTAADVGPELASLPQNCQGFEAKPQ